VGGLRQQKKGGESVQSFIRLCEVMHCRVGGKPVACQDERFDYMPTVSAAFSTSSAVKISSQCTLFILRRHHLFRWLSSVWVVVPCSLVEA
jgi:hypothetical protein